MINAYILIGSNGSSLNSWACNTISSIILVLQTKLWMPCLVIQLRPLFVLPYRHWYQLGLLQYLLVTVMMITLKNSFLSWLWICPRSLISPCSPVYSVITTGYGWEMIWTSSNDSLRSYTPAPRGTFWHSSFVYAPQTLFCLEGYEDCC